MANFTTDNATAEVSDLIRFERSLQHYYLPYGYIAFVNTTVDLYICCMLLAKKPPLNPAGKLRWKKIICAYFAITWVVTPFIMVFIQSPRTDSRAMRDMMKGSTMTVATNHWMILVALLIVMFSKEKDHKTEEGRDNEVVRTEEIQCGPETLCRLSMNLEPSTSTDEVTEAISSLGNHTEKESLLAEFSRNSSSTRLQQIEDTVEEVASVSPQNESTADTLISILDQNTQISLSICLLSFLPGYCLMFLPICELLYAILKHETADDELQRHTKEILIFHGKTGHTEIENLEEKRKKRRVLLKLEWKLGTVAFYLLVGISSVWMQYLLIATIARDPTGISHLLQFENLSLTYALLPKLLLFAF